MPPGCWVAEIDHIPPTPEPPPIPEVLREDAARDRGAPEGGDRGGMSGRGGSGRTQMGRMFAIGMDFAYGVIGCAALGWAADWWLKTSPRWLLVGALLGVVVAMYRFIREGLKVARSGGNVGGRDGPGGAGPKPRG